MPDTRDRGGNIRSLVHAIYDATPPPRGDNIRPKIQAS